MAPKLGILDSNKLFGDVSGSKASWSIDFDKLLSGAAIPLKVVGVKNGVESEPLELDDSLVLLVVVSLVEPEVDPPVVPVVELAEVPDVAVLPEVALSVL